MLTTAELQRQTGATFRMIDYWVRQGYLPVANYDKTLDPQPTEGAGTRRYYSAKVLPICQALVGISDILQSGRGVQLYRMVAADPYAGRWVFRRPGLTMTLEATP